MGLALPPRDSCTNFQLLAQACAAEKRAHEAVVPGEYRNTKGVSELKASANKAIQRYSKLTARNLTNVPFSRLDSDERMLNWQNRSQEWVIAKNVNVNPAEEIRRARLREARSIPSSTQPSTDDDKSSQIAAFSKLMCPQTYLEFAARHSDKALATKEGISLEGVQEAITDAAHWVAARDMRSVMAVFLEFEHDRLRRNVHPSHKDFVIAINNRAKEHIKQCGIEKIDLSWSSCPCKVWGKSTAYKKRCRRHDICTLMHMLQATNDKWRAEKADEAEKLAEDARKLLRAPSEAGGRSEFPSKGLEVSV